MEYIFERTIRLIGSENLSKLKNAHVVICGIGGVGSYVLEALARVGIGKFTLIDKDVVDITNINRQIIALQSNVGVDKVEVAKNRILDINPDIEVVTKRENICRGNISDILGVNTLDYVVDCVDNVEAKLSIIVESNKRNVECISCMGMGNKLNPLDIKISDISKTKVCPLAKIIRKKLRDIGILHQKVVYSEEVPIKNAEFNDNILGSISFVPSTAGLVIASQVVKDLINRD